MGSVATYRLKPDAVVFRRGQAVAVVDAKYKRLTPTAAAPYGPQRDDLYQLTSYVVRYGQVSATLQGALVYPQALEDDFLPRAERGNPWRLQQGSQVYFLTLPHELDEAVAKLREQPWVRGS